MAPIAVNLIDPKLPGLVSIELAPSFESPVQIETRILPLEGTTVRPSTWSLVKILFR